MEYDAIRKRFDEFNKQSDSELEILSRSLMLGGLIFLFVLALAEIL